MSKTLPTFSLEKRLWKKGYFLIGVDEVGRGALAGPVVCSAVVFSPPTQMKNVPQSRIPLRGKKIKMKNYILKLKKIENIGIDDSKRLTSKLRIRLAAEIKECCQKYAIVTESVGTINRIGIVKATEKAMRRAVVMVYKSVSDGSCQPSSPSRHPRLSVTRNLIERDQTAGARWGTPDGRHPSQFRAFVLVDGRHVKYIPGIGLKYQKNIFDGDRKCISIAAASILAKVHRDGLMEKLSRKPKYKKYGWEKNKGYGTKRHIKAIKRYGLTRLHRKIFVRNIIKSN